MIGRDYLWNPLIVQSYAIATVGAMRLSLNAIRQWFGLACVGVLVEDSVQQLLYMIVLHALDLAVLVSASPFANRYTNQQCPPHVTLKNRFTQYALAHRCVYHTCRQLRKNRFCYDGLLRANLTRTRDARTRCLKAWSNSLFKASCLGNGKMYVTTASCFTPRETHRRHPFFGLACSSRRLQLFLHYFPFEMNVANTGGTPLPLVHWQTIWCWRRCVFVLFTDRHDMLQVHVCTDTGALLACIVLRLGQQGH